jgi:probable non-F420 flavinoid oxidoreductase
VVVAVIGYHGAHERFKPSELLRFMQLAQESGFDAGMCSDHFHPWNTEQGESGYTWSWLGAALQGTAFSYGMVCAPGQRYHPAIIAQAAATLSEMYPERLWCAFGTGQYLNEHITGEVWPSKEDRKARLIECVDIIRALWAGETVSHKGMITVNEAKLFTRPAVPPQIFGAALGEDTAEWVGGWADGVITTAKSSPDDLKRFIEAFRRGGGDGKPVIVQALHGYGSDLAATQEQAWKQWRTNLFGSEIQADLKMHSHFEAVASLVRPEDMRKAVRISTKLDDHIKWLQDDLAQGVDRIYLHNAADDQRGFITDFGRHVLPALRG